MEHPLDPAERATIKQQGRPVSIGDDCWVGAGAIICPRVTVGEGATIAAGAVVVKDVEPFTVVGGNPARLLRRLQQPAGGAAQAPVADGEEAGADTASWSLVDAQH